MSQAKQILELLKDGQWHCTNEMRAMFIGDPPRRMIDLKEKGYNIEEPRRCRQHNHKGGQKEWRLKVSYKEQVAKFPDGTEKVIKTPIYS